MPIKSILAGSLALCLALPAHAHMIIEDAYARAASPLAKSGAAFMRITNHSDVVDRLVAVRSEAAVRVELHTHVEQDGIMSMVHLEEGFAFEPGETVALERGAKHVMFMGLTEPFEQGKEITITLVFETAGEVPLTILVDNDHKADLSKMDHAGHDHSTHQTN